MFVLVIHLILVLLVVECKSLSLIITMATSSTGFKKIKVLNFGLTQVFMCCGGELRSLLLCIQLLPTLH